MTDYEDVQFASVLGFAVIIIFELKSTSKPRYIMPQHAYEFTQTRKKPVEHPFSYSPIHPPITTTWPLVLQPYSEKIDQWTNERVKAIIKCKQMNTGKWKYEMLNINEYEMSCYILWLLCSILLTYDNLITLNLIGSYAMNFRVIETKFVYCIHENLCQRVLKETQFIQRAIYDMGLKWSLNWTSSLYIQSFFVFYVQIYM